jgi:hypothetical protein
MHIGLFETNQITSSGARGLAGYDVALTWRRSPVRIRPSPSFFFETKALKASNGAFSAARIMAGNKDNKAKKLHNSDEKLHNFDEPDLSWQEEIDLRPEDGPRLLVCRKWSYFTNQNY